VFCILAFMAQKSDRTETIVTVAFSVQHSNKTARVGSVVTQAAKLARLTHKIAIQLHLGAESYIICSSRSRRLVRKLFDTPFYRRVK
jgi:hypothetical protein